ncbi:hypothetical protein ACVWXQ_007239 [Bradyrhizobium sp. S3.14.4]
MPRSPWAASAVWTKEGRRAGRGQRRRDLARHVAGLAEAGDDDAALGVADQVDRLGEGRAQRTAQGGGERVDAAALRL